MRHRAEKHLYGISKGKSKIGSMSQDSASDALDYAADHPGATSQRLEVAMDFHSSTQDSYDSIKAAEDINILSKSKNKRRK